MMEKNEQRNSATQARLGDMCGKAEVNADEEREWNARRMPWKDCSIEQKLEKLRIAAREQGNAMRYISKMAYEATDLARQHQHAHDGAVLRPAVDHRLSAGEAGQMDVLA